MWDGEDYTYSDQQNEFQSTAPEDWSVYEPTVSDDGSQMAPDYNWNPNYNSMSGAEDWYNNPDYISNTAPQGGWDAYEPTVPDDGSKMIPDFNWNPNSSAGPSTNWGQMAGNAMTSGKDFLSSLFRSTPGSPSTAAMLSPFLAALYNKKTAPAQAAATNQYIQGQQQRLDPFGGYRGEANQNWQASNQRLMDLKNNRNLSPEMLAQDALSKYTVGRQDARGSNRFNNGRTQLMAGLANQRNVIQDEMKLNEMYGRQGGAGFNPSGLEGLLKQGLAANQNAANPLMQLFAALGQTTNSFSPQTQVGQY